MHHTMIVRMPELTGYATIRYVAVSLPLVADLVDGVKYMLPDDVKQSEDDAEKRRDRSLTGRHASGCSWQ